MKFWVRARSLNAFYWHAPPPKQFMPAHTSPNVCAGPHLGLAQDLQHLVIGQEEEAREGDALDFQVGGQALLDLLQQPALTSNQ